MINDSSIVRSLLLLATLFTLTQSAAGSDKSNRHYTVKSPSGHLNLHFGLSEGIPRYSLTLDNVALVDPSRLGFWLQDAPDLDDNFQIDSVVRSSHDETWIQPWGEKKAIRSAYQELKVTLQEQGDLSRQMVIVFRVFDDGVGFRYEWPQQTNLQKLIVNDELTEFNLTQDCMAWWIEAYQDNRYEYLYQSSLASEMPTVHTPVTFERSDGVCLSIHEAALTDFASMTLSRSDALSLKADLVPWSDGIKVRAPVPHKSPWRTIQVGRNAGELITSHMILNLNEPCKLEDTSWIRPCKYCGVWWEMHLNRSTWGSGERHGANTENVRRYIDFAAANGLDGVLVEGWNHGWDGDWVKNGHNFNFSTPYDDFDIYKLAEEARQKGVYLIGHHETGGAVMNYESQLQDAFSLYENLGVKAIKSGYVLHGQNIKRVDDQGTEHKEWHHGQFMIRHYRKVLEEAAQHRVMLNVHEPIKPTGIRRTYPNMMTREGARGQEFNAWGADGGNPPEHTTILPFTRLLAGPMDFTPGIFDLLFEEPRPENRVNTTLVKQLALYVVIYSPLQMVADLPENYAKHPEVFQFIRDVPVDWEDTVVLHAKIGDYVTIARKERDGDDWFLGSITDEQSRNLEASLSFLDAGRKYIVEIYRDSEHADWKSNPYGYEIERREVDAQTKLQLRLAPGGGQAIRITPK